MSATYLLFRGDAYYPCGGTDDLEAVFRASDETAACEHAHALIGPRGRRYEWAELVRLDGCTTTTIGLEGWDQ